MAEQDGGQARTERNEGQQSHSGTGTAIKAVAAAAATGAAAYAARKALTKNGESGRDSRSSGRSRSGEGGLVGSIFSGSWDAARDQLVPLAEDAAGAAGKYVAENGPDVVRDRLVPKFISSFESAQGR